MKISKKDDTPNQPIRIDNDTLEWVEHYDYLGTRITKNGKINAEILHRKYKASQIYHQLNSTIINKKELTNKTKIQIYQTIYLPILTYGLKSAILNEKHLSQLQTSEMKFLRRTLGKARRNKIRNTKIREDTEQKPIQKLIETRQLAWYGHVSRMNENRIPKKVVECKAEGKRNRGRPRTTYDKYITKIGMKRGKTTG